MRRATVLITTLGLISALALMPVSAHAATSSGASEVGSAVDTIATDQVTSNECLAAAAAAGVHSDEARTTCTWSETLEVSRAQPVTDDEVAALTAGLSPTDTRAILESRAAGAIHSKAYSYTRNNVSDRERIAGTFYYDGSRAWVKSSYRGYTGSLRCSVDWAVGFDVTNTSCAESGSSSRRQLTAVWKFAAGIKGSPISWAESQTMFVSASGTISR